MCTDAFSTWDVFTSWRTYRVQPHPKSKSNYIGFHSLPFYNMVNHVLGLLYCKQRTINLLRQIVTCWKEGIRSFQNWWKTWKACWETEKRSFADLISDTTRSTHRRMVWSETTVQWKGSPAIFNFLVACARIKFHWASTQLASLGSYSCPHHLS